jgi:hypothetical protein
MFTRHIAKQNIESYDRVGRNEDHSSPSQLRLRRVASSWAVLSAVTVVIIRTRCPIHDAGNLLPPISAYLMISLQDQTLLNGAISGTKVLSSFPNLITTFPTPASTTSPTPNFVCLTFSPVL